jgi:prepilin-type N-terminal cleavage/methylation domain-containing protein
MQGANNHTERRRGFTLLETLTVVAIIGILTSFAILVYSNHRRGLRAQTSAQQIESLFTTARALAINQNAHFRAVLDLDTSGMWIDRTDQDGQVVTPKVVTPENWSFYTTVVDVTVDGTSSTAGVVPIRFRPNGSSQSARILLASEGGDSTGGEDLFTIKLYGPTARSRIFPGEHE